MLPELGALQFEDSTSMAAAAVSELVIGLRLINVVEGRQRRGCPPGAASIQPVVYRPAGGLLAPYIPYEYG